LIYLCLSLASFATKVRFCGLSSLARRFFGFPHAMAPAESHLTLMVGTYTATSALTLLRSRCCLTSCSVTFKVAGPKSLYLLGSFVFAPTSPVEADLCMHSCQAVADASHQATRETSNSSCCSVCGFPRFRWRLGCYTQIGVARKLMEFS
jgi:hypothetical protein